MSYLRKIEYCIMPKESFKVTHNCSGCGRKTRFVNTNCFRVNANGSKIDVWLIYQCEKCKHTLNVTIYERQKSNKVPKEEYERFLANDEFLAKEYGRTPAFFTKNRLEVDWAEIPYTYVDVESGQQAAETVIDWETMESIVIHNPCGMKIRPEKQAAEVLKLSRSQIKKLMESGEIAILQEKDKVTVSMPQKEKE